MSRSFSPIILVGLLASGSAQAADVSTETAESAGGRPAAAQTKLESQTKFRSLSYHDGKTSISASHDRIRTRVNGGDFEETRRTSYCIFGDGQSECGTLPLGALKATRDRLSFSKDGMKVKVAVDPESEPNHRFYLQRDRRADGSSTSSRETSTYRDGPATLEMPSGDVVDGTGTYTTGSRMYRSKSQAE